MMGTRLRPSRDGGYFQIEVEGLVDGRWRGRLGDLELEPRPGAERSSTIIAGWLSDQARLHAVLAAIRDLGLVLVSVNRIDEAGIHRAQ